MQHIHDELNAYSEELGIDDHFDEEVKVCLAEPWQAQMNEPVGEFSIRIEFVKVTDLEE